MNAETLFWELAAELQAQDARVAEGTLMNGRCLRLGKEFLALVDHKGSGLVVKLPRERVAELIAQGKGSLLARLAGFSKNGYRSPRPTETSGERCCRKAWNSSADKKRSTTLS